MTRLPLSCLRTFMARACCVLVLALPAACPTLGFSQASREPSLALQRCTQLPIPRSQHGCTVAGNRIYVLGGFDGSAWRRDVISAEILPGGKLGTWRTERPMPEFRSYLGGQVETINNCIYVVSGTVSPRSLSSEAEFNTAKDIIWSRVQPDGSLGEWQRSDPYPGDPVNCSATAFNQQYLFMSGGQQQLTPRADILRVVLRTDGTVGNWVRAGKLPVPLWFHGLAVLNGRMYVWGGLTGKTSDTASSKVWSAPVLDAGLIGDWRPEEPLPGSIYSSAFCGFNNYLICIAGRYNGGVPTNVIWYAKVDAEGTVQGWQVIKTDLDSRVYLALGLDRSTGNVFTVGGQYKSKPGTQLEKVLQSVQGFNLPR